MEFYVHICFVHVLDFETIPINSQLGSRLIELLTETAHVHNPVNQSADCPPDVRPAFRHTFKTLAKDPG